MGQLGRGAGMAGAVEAIGKVLAENAGRGLKAAHDMRRNRR